MDTYDCEDNKISHYWYDVCAHRFAVADKVFKLLWIYVPTLATLEPTQQ